MQVFRIPVWDNESGLTHIATTWQIAKDKDFTSIVDQVVDSEEYLNFYKTNIIIPDGAVYWVRAKRKFKEVENDTWIGPKPVVSENTGTNELIKPPVSIEEPYVTDVNLDYEDGLTITLAPYSGSVPHKSTNWILEDLEGNKLLVRLNDEENLLGLNIPNSEIDFTQIPYVKLRVSFNGELGAVSPVHTEVLNIGKKYYSIKANRGIVSSSENYEGEIIQETDRPVTLARAELYDVTMKKICDATIDGNKFTFDQSCLVPNQTYYVKLYIYFDNDTSTTFTTIYSIYTKDVTEKIRFDTNRTYNEIYKIVTTQDDIDILHATENDKLYTEGEQLTEETYVGSILLLSRGVDEDFKWYFHDKNTGRLVYHKPAEGIDIGTKDMFKFELLPDNSAIVDKLVDNKRYVHIYDFNPYELKFASLKGYYRDDELVPDYNTNAYGVLNGELYWAAVDKNDRTKIYIRKVDRETKTLVTVFHDRLDPDDTRSIDNIIFGRILGDRFVVIPQYYSTDSEVFGFVYDVSKNERYKLFTVPEEVRTQHVKGVTLDNGNFGIFRTRLDDDGYLFFSIIPADGSDIITKSQNLMIPEDIELKSLIRLKSGNIIQFGYDSNGKFTQLLWS